MRFYGGVQVMIRSVRLSGCVLLLMACTNPVLAAGSSSLQFTPSVSVEQAYIDNLFYQPDNRVDSWKTAIAPKLEVSGDIKSFEATFSVSAEKGLYSESSDDDYTDSQIYVKSQYELDRSNEIQFLISYDRDHEDRGTGLSDGPKAFLVDSPIEFDRTLLDARYIVGSEKSRGKLVFRGSYLKQEYTNFPQFTDRRSYESLLGSANFSYRVRSDTRLLVNGQFGTADYINDPLVVDGEEDSFDRSFQKLLIGATWDLTSKTSGTAKFGYRFIDFEDKDREDFNGPSWEINIDWEPFRYSRFHLSSLQEDRESTGDASFVNFRETRVEWNLEWTVRVKSTLFLSMGQKTFEDSVPAREDDLSGAGFGLELAMRRWLDVGFRAVHDTVDSSVNVFDYDRNQYVLYANARF